MEAAGQPVSLLNQIDAVIDGQVAVGLRSGEPESWHPDRPSGDMVNRRLASQRLAEVSG